MYNLFGCLYTAASAYTETPLDFSNNFIDDEPPTSSKLFTPLTAAHQFGRHNRHHCCPSLMLQHCNKIHNTNEQQNTVGL